MRLKPFAILTAVLSLPLAANALPSGSGGGTALINKDLLNLGPAAEDLAIVLEGSDPIGGSFNGYHSGDTVGWFGNPTSTIVNGNTVVHWQGFSDGTDNTINNNQKIHVGYVGDLSRKVVDMYWTDHNGNRIPGSIVYDTVTHTTYQGKRFTWDIANAQSAAIAVSNIRYAVLPQPLPLDQLSQQNANLMAALRSLGSNFVLVPGETRSFEVPGDVPAGSAVVAVYTENAAGTGAILTNYIQTIAQTAAN